MTSLLHATCANEACAEHGIDKPCELVLPEDVVIQCGECQQPCTTREIEMPEPDAELVVEQPPAQT